MSSGYDREEVRTVLETLEKNDLAYSEIRISSRGNVVFHVVNLSDVEGDEPDWNSAISDLSLIGTELFERFRGHREPVPMDTRVEHEELLSILRKLDPTDEIEVVHQGVMSVENELRYYESVGVYDSETGEWKEMEVHD